jgi:hypothetical protein
MKSFRRLCSAAVLTALFALPTLAGDMPCPPSPLTGIIDTPTASAPGDVGFPPASATGSGVVSFGDILTPGIAILMLAIAS